MAKRNKTTSAATKPNRSGVPVNVNIPKPLRAALDAYLDAAKPEVTITAAATAAFEEFLASRGFWPPRSE